MNTQTYPSKIDPWLWIVLATVPTLPIVLGLFLLRSSPIAGLACFASVLFDVALVGSLVWPCRYVLEQDHLLIQSGRVRQRIPYQQISKIETSNSPISAPALSLRRVKITFGQKCQLVSPDDREEFMRALQVRVNLFQPAQTARAA